MRKVIAISLSLILLLSNAGITLASHYCGGHAVESKLMLGQENLDCGMDNANAVCDSSIPLDSEILSSPCCENHFYTLHLDNAFSASQILSIQHDLFIQAFIPVFLNLFSFHQAEVRQFVEHSIPIPVRDIGILFQTFRI